MFSPPFFSSIPVFRVCLQALLSLCACLAGIFSHRSFLKSSPKMKNGIVSKLCRIHSLSDFTYSLHSYTWVSQFNASQTAVCSQYVDLPRKNTPATPSQESLTLYTVSRLKSIVNHLFPGIPKKCPRSVSAALPRPPSLRKTAPSHWPRQRRKSRHRDSNSP